MRTDEIPDLCSMEEVISTAPASLSFIFKVKLERKGSLAKMGSVGVGCTIDKKVTVTVKQDTKSCMLFNGSKVTFPTAEYVVRQLTQKPVAIHIISPLPLGSGFGISGAASIAIAFALNKLFHGRKTKEELVAIAHTAEIINHTGLGSVATQITGGFLIKNKPGLPVSATRLPFTGDKLYAVIIGRLPTSSVLQDEKRLLRVNSAAETALRKVKEKKKILLGEVLDISYTFAKTSGLLTDLRLLQIIEAIQKAGGSATMAMLGRVVISNKKPYLDKNYRIEELIITNDVASVI